MTTLSLSNSHSVVLVSDADDELLCFSWRLKRSDHKWYVVTSVTRRGKHMTIRLHRLVAARMGLRVRAGIDVHHADGDGLNNMRENLRVCGHVAHARIHSWAQAATSRTGSSRR